MIYLSDPEPSDSSRAKMRINSPKDAAAEFVFIYLVFVRQTTSDFQFHSSVRLMTTSNKRGNVWEEESGSNN